MENDNHILISRLEELLEKTKHFENTAGFFERLVFMKQSRYLAPYNAFLAMQQRSNIKFLLSADQWENRHHRKPRDGVQPIVIMKPFGPVDFVYDIEDTMGEPIKGYSSNLPTEEVCQRLYPIEGWIPSLEQRYNLIVYNCRRLGLSFSEALLEPSLLGQAKLKAERFRIPKHELKKEDRLTNYEVQVNRFYPVEAKLGALVHELAHIYCGHLEPESRRPVNRSQMQEEFEAEAVSYLYCYRNGFRPKSEEYLVSYLQEGWRPSVASFENILKSLKNIEDVAKDPTVVDGTPPLELEVSIGGYFGPSYNIELLGTTLHYRETGPDHGNVHDTQIKPTKKQWESFWKTCNRVGVWGWDKAYENPPGVCDGTQWSVHIKQDFRTINSKGSNSFPGEEQAMEGCVGYPYPFRAFLHAISRLTGGLPFE